MGTVVKFPERGAYSQVRPRRCARRVRHRYHSAGHPDRAVRSITSPRVLVRKSPPPADNQGRPPPHEAPLKVGTPMSPRSWLSLSTKIAIRRLATLLVSGCTQHRRFGRLQSPLVSDDIHAWVGQEAAAHAGAPVSVNNLTDDERTLRDLGVPADRAALRPYALGRGGLRIRPEARVSARSVDIRHRRLLRASDGRVPSLQHRALQPVDRRYAQRHRAHRSVLPDRAPRSRCRSAAREEYANTSPI